MSTPLRKGATYSVCDMNYNTGCASVDTVGSIRFAGNLVPHSWYQHIRYINKRGEFTDPWAVLILADIVYWYRPTEIRDETTGEVIGYRKKFADNKLQRSPSAFSKLLGCSTKVIRAALALLEKLGLIDIELRSKTTGYGTIPNLMFIGLNALKVKEITEKLTQPSDAKILETTYRVGEEPPCAEMGKCLLPISGDAPPDFGTPDPELGTSSIYIEFTKENSKEHTQSAGKKVCENSEVFDQEEIRTVACEVVQEEVKQQDLSVTASVNLEGQLTRRDNKEELPRKRSKAREQYEQGLITQLPPMELKAIADEEIYDYVSAYRKSGNICCLKPNDIDQGFIDYVRDNCLSKGVKSSANAASYIQNCEKDPTRWRSLTEVVTAWVNHKKNLPYDLRNKTAEQKAKDKNEAMQTLMNLKVWY